VTDSQDQTHPMIVLSDCLDMKAAGPLAVALLAARGRDLDLDASGVRRFGGQCLQVLLSARMTWAEDGFAFRFTVASPEFRDGLALMGCADLGDAASLQD
jgi:chemotaxis protein CheX